MMAEGICKNVVNPVNNALGCPAFVLTVSRRAYKHPHDLSSLIHSARPPEPANGTNSDGFYAVWNSCEEHTPRAPILLGFKVMAEGMGFEPTIGIISL